MALEVTLCPSATLPVCGLSSIQMVLGQEQCGGDPGLP